MLDFVAKMFRGFINSLLWLVLIGFIIGGFVVGGIGFGSWGFSFGYAILGLISGGIFGFITIILLGGLIANFLNMVDDIGAIKYQLSGKGASSTSNKSAYDKKCSKCNKTFSGTYSGCPHCGSSAYEQTNQV